MFKSKFYITVDTILMGRSIVQSTDIQECDWEEDVDQHLPYNFYIK